MTQDGLWRKLFTERICERDRMLEKLAFIESNSEKFNSRKYVRKVLQLFGEVVLKDHSITFMLSLYFVVLFMVSTLLNNIDLTPLLQATINCDFTMIETKAFCKNCLCSRFEKLTISNVKGFIELPLVRKIQELEIVNSGITGYTNISCPVLKELGMLIISIENNSLSRTLIFLFLSFPGVEVIEILRIKGFHSELMKSLNFNSLNYIKHMNIIGSTFEDVNLTSIKNANTISISDSSISNLYASALENLEKLNFDRIRSKGNISLQMPQLRMCDTLSITNSKGLKKVALPKLKKVRSLYVDQTTFTMGNIQMSNLNSVEIIQITNTKNLHTINLPKTQAIERVNIINTIGLHNFSSNAKTVRHATFLHNTDLKGIELLQLKFSVVSLRHNIALKSLKLQSLESGGVMIKNCKNLNKVSVPKFKRGHLTLIGNPQLSAIITKRNKSRTTLMVSNCSKLNGTEIDVQLNEARNHCKSSNSSSLFHLITCAMIKNLVNSQ